MQSSKHRTQQRSSTQQHAAARSSSTQQQRSSKQQHRHTMHSLLRPTAVHSSTAAMCNSHVQ